MKVMEIHTSVGRRVASLVGFLLLVLLLAGVLVWLFLQFTGSWRLAFALVTFMLLYMAVMGYLASRRPQNPDS